MIQTRTLGGVSTGGVFLLLALYVPAVRAELLYFKGGGQAQLPATVRGDMVRLETPDGPRDFDRGDFRKIVPGFWPPTEWPARRRAAQAGDSATRFSAAWWALENGLTPQAETMLRELHALDPAHQPTSRMVALLDRLDRPCPGPDLGPLRQAMGAGFSETGSAHLIVLHQHEPAEIQERLDVLERVVRSFYLLLAAQGLELTVPNHRLASAWFADQRDYQAFLRAQNARVFQSTHGYYHPTLNAVFAFDSRSGGTQKSARDELAARRRALEKQAGLVEALPSNGRRLMAFPGETARPLDRGECLDLLSRLERDLRRRQLLLDLDRRSIDLGTAAHEMVHQLVAMSGLAPCHDSFPTWLHEGLAAQFEVIRGGRWAGISRAHDLRLPDWRTITPSPQLPALLRDQGFGHGYRRDLYAESWALVYFLRKEHAELFFAYIDLLRTPGRTPDPSASRFVATFEAIFGPETNSLGRRWCHYVDTVETPLDEGPRIGTDAP